MKKRFYAALFLILLLLCPVSRTGIWESPIAAAVRAEDDAVPSVTLPATSSAAAWLTRDQLNEQEAALYDAMSAQFQAGNASVTYNFSPPLEFKSSNEAQNRIKELCFRAYEAFYRDHPQVFWIDKSNITIAPDSTQSGGTVRITGVRITVNITRITDLENKKASLDAKVRQIVENTGNTDFDKVRAFHDYLTKNCQYDEAAAQTPKNYPISYESFGALMYGNATCEGYAKAFKLLCDSAGIPCVIVGGVVEKEAHMWNYVQVDGAWYLVDATFDDPIGGVPGYDYFLKGTDSTGDHINEGSFTNGFDPHITDPAVSKEDYILPDMTQTPEAVEKNPAKTKGDTCRVFFRQPKNGRLSVEYTYASGSMDNGQSVPYGIVVRIVALPDRGWELDSISVDMGGSVRDMGKMVSLITVTDDCEISAEFKKAG